MLTVVFIKAMLTMSFQYCVGAFCYFFLFIAKCVSEYMMVNQLHINLTKSYYINFTNNMTISENLRQPSDYSQLKINDAVIKEVDEIKFLELY